MAPGSPAATQHRDEARDRYVAALTEAKAATVAYGRAVEEVDWLTAFSVAAFNRGDVHRFHGKAKITVEDHRRVLRANVMLDVSALLMLAETAADPPVERNSGRTHDQPSMRRFKEGAR